MSVAEQLFDLISAYCQSHQETQGALPQIEHDEAWPSPCEVATNDGLSEWQPVRRASAASLTPLSEALEVAFPDELSDFYGHLYSGNLPASIDGHRIELLQPWNEDDFVRLQQNITGHVLMKRKLKQPETVFIGLTEQDDLLITVSLTDGGVYLEYVGKTPHHQLAPSIGEFLQRIETIA